MCNSSPCLESILVFFLPCRSGISHIPSSRYIVGIITSTFPTRTGVNVHCTWLYFGCSHLSMSSISQIIPQVMSVQVSNVYWIPLSKVSVYVETNLYHPSLGPNNGARERVRFNSRGSGLCFRGRSRYTCSRFSATVRPRSICAHFEWTPWLGAGGLLTRDTYLLKRRG